MSIDEITECMEQYFRRLHAIELSDVQLIAQMDELMHQGDEGSRQAQALMEQQIARKNQVYSEYWHRDDDYWEPAYLADDPHHDWERVAILDVKSNGEDCFAVRYTYARRVGDPTEYLMIFRAIDGKPRIADLLF